MHSILASQLRTDWSVTLDRLDNKYYVTWGSSLTANAAPASDTGNDGKVAAMASSGGSLPPQGKMLGKLDQKDFKEVIAKGMKTYGTWGTTHALPYHNMKTRKNRSLRKRRF